MARPAAEGELLRWRTIEYWKRPLLAGSALEGFRTRQKGPPRAPRPHLSFQQADEVAASAATSSACWKDSLFAIMRCAWAFNASMGSGSFKRESLAWARGRFPVAA